MFRSRFGLAIATCFLFTPFVGLAVAQDEPRPQRRDLFDGLLRRLVESQTERGQPRVVPPPVPQEERLREVDMTHVRRHAGEIGRESARLYDGLTADARQAPNMRAYLPEMLRIRTAAGLLAERTARATSHAALLPEMRALDRDWRVLSRRLQLEAGLSDGCAESVRSLDGFHRELCEHCGIDRQPDAGSLHRVVGPGQLRPNTAALLTDLDRLLDCITLKVLLDLPSPDAVFRATRQFHTASDHFAECVASGEAARILAEDFDAIQQAWPGLVAALRTVPDPHVAYSLRQVERSLIAVRDSVRPRKQLDRQAALELAASLEEVSKAFERECERLVGENRFYAKTLRETVTEAADEFSDAAHHLRGHLEDGDAPEQLRKCLNELVVAWDRLSDECLPRLRDADRVVLSRAATKISPLVDELRAGVGR